MGTSKGHNKYITPDEFLELWDAYKDSVDKAPHKEEVLSNKGDIKEVKKTKPYLRQGFQSYVYRLKGFHIHQYIDNYKGMYDDYLGVVTCARDEWEDDQISGSLTGKYKSPNLVARINNIKEKTENINTSTNVNILSVDPMDTGKED